MDIKVTIPNLKQMQKAFADAPQDMYREANTAIRSSIIKVEQIATMEAPVDTHTLQGSLKHGFVWGPLYGAVGPTVNYALYVHEGTRPHIIRYKKRGRGGLYNKRTRQGFGRVVHHPGTKPNRFMKRAADQSQRDIDKFFKDALERVVNNIARRSK
jgi:hypothetical protein